MRYHQRWFSLFFFLSGDTITGASFWKKNKIIHITQFWFHLSPLSVSVCGLKGSDLCQGINWAKMRLNHKCKVASAATRLYSLVAYQPSLCRHRVTLCLFGVSPPWSAALSASRKHRRWDEVVILPWIHDPAISWTQGEGINLTWSDKFTLKWF